MNDVISVPEPAQARIKGDHLLEVKNLSVFFNTPRGKVRSVDDISFTLGRGKTLGIVGESGSGKSVTSKAVMGLLPRRTLEMSGSILYEGSELVGRSEADYRKPPTP